MVLVWELLKEICAGLALYLWEESVAFRVIVMLAVMGGLLYLGHWLSQHPNLLHNR